VFGLPVFNEAPKSEDVLGKKVQFHSAFSWQFVELDVQVHVSASVLAEHSH
jgi:hypothetical protein